MDEKEYQLLEDEIEDGNIIHAELCLSRYNSRDNSTKTFTIYFHDGPFKGKRIKFDDDDLFDT